MSVIRSLWARGAVRWALAGVLVAFAAWIIWAPPARIGYAPEQPVSYRHDIHAGVAGQKTFDGKDQYGIDCQYCKTMLSDAEVAALSKEKRDWLLQHRKNVGMRGGEAILPEPAAK